MCGGGGGSANIGLGRVHYGQSRFSAAETQFAKAAKGVPSSVVAWYGLGMSRYKLKRYRDAIDPLALAAPSLPSEPQAHYALAVCYDKTGQYAKAYESYRRALSAGLSGEEKDHARQRVAVLGGVAALP